MAFSKIFVPKFNAFIVSKEKWGKYKLDNGTLIKWTQIAGEECHVHCHNNCKNISKIKMYSGKVSPLNKLFICMSCRNAGEGNPFYGKKHTEESKKIITDKFHARYKKEDNYFYGKNMWEIYDADKRENFKQKIKLKCSGKNNHFYGKKHTEESRRKISDNLKLYYKDNPLEIERLRNTALKNLNNQIGKKNSIERLVENYLSSLECTFKYNKIINSKYQYDFVINEKYLLEVQGDYWHANPLKYGDGKKKLSERQMFKVSRDKDKKEYAIENGYKIFYIWESDIRSNDFSKIDEMIRIIDNEKV